MAIAPPRHQAATVVTPPATLHDRLETMLTQLQRPGQPEPLTAQQEAQLQLALRIEHAFALGSNQTAMLEQPGLLARLAELKCARTRLFREGRSGMDYSVSVAAVLLWREKLRAGLLLSGPV